MIEIKHLSKSFGEKHVLDDINIKIQNGNIFGLVGINGAGKTTLLRLISGILKSDNGDILFDGKNNFVDESVRQDLFFLNEDPFYPRNSSIKSLIEFYKQFYNLDIYKMHHYIDLFKLDINAKNIDKFSKGMKRQLFICIALSIAPRYLLLDEAFDGLDPMARLTFKKAISEMATNNKSIVIISSHSLKELEDICDLYGLIDNNHITVSGEENKQVEEVNTYQMLFKNHVDEKAFKEFNPSYFKQEGSVYKVVIAGEEEKVKADIINKLHPDFIETIPMNFEEFFMNEVKNRGYKDE